MLPGVVLKRSAIPDGAFMAQQLIAIMANDSKVDLYVGASTAEFVELYEVFEPAVLAAGGRQPGTAYKATKYENRIRLFLLLSFIRSNLTSSMGELALDWARASINKDTRHCASLMVPALRNALGNLWFQPVRAAPNRIHGARLPCCSRLCARHCPLYPAADACRCHSEKCAHGGRIARVCVARLSASRTLPVACLVRCPLRGRLHPRRSWSQRRLLSRPGLLRWR
jgi:hypothetical protein